MASKMKLVLMFMTQNEAILSDKIPHFVSRTTFTNSFKQATEGPGFHGTEHIRTIPCFFFYSPDVQTSGKMVDGENRPLTSDGVGSGTYPSDATV